VFLECSGAVVDVVFIDFDSPPLSKYENLDTPKNPKHLKDTTCNFKQVRYLLLQSVKVPEAGRSNDTMTIAVTSIRIQSSLPILQLLYTSVRAFLLRFAKLAR
jgi:hypothetical protein